MTSCVAYTQLISSYQPREVYIISFANPVPEQNYPYDTMVDVGAGDVYNCGINGFKKIPLIRNNNGSRFETTPNAKNLEILWIN